MGGCSSGTDYAEIPKHPSSMINGKFKGEEHRVFVIPTELSSVLEVYSSNGNFLSMQVKSRISSPKTNHLSTSPTNN